METISSHQRRWQRFPKLLSTALAMSVATVSCQATRSAVLPAPEPPFKGKIGRTYKESQPDKIPVTKAPEGAPNVLVVLIDDCGYGQWGTFGGQIPTPNLDRLASMGLRYARFHTTALSSPTRAALLTGRNHHSAGTGVITELGDAYPGYTGQIPKSAAMVSEILRQNGYSTAFIGKNHNVPDWETSVSGPYDRWPGLQGFDHFYGFIGGEANQWAPAVYRDHQRVEMEIPKGKEGGYTLNDSLADETIKYIFQQKSVTPDRPFFVYFAPGATHAPHHVPKEWLDKFKGQFDQGWDKYREETYHRQLKLGVIPLDTKLTPRPKEIPAYDSLTLDQKHVAARLMEAFAAYTAQTDYEVGRVLDALEQVGQLHNTLIFWIIGDNGASMEGMPYGAFNEMAALGGMPEPPAFLLQHLDEIGGPNAYNHYPVGWAWAMNTPFQWTKQIASHYGGTRNGMVISWPDRIKDQGGIRSHWHHTIDIVPSILDATGLQQPSVVNGVAQKPIEGVSMAYTFDDPKAPSARRTQYFEMFGNRGIYHDGWVACTTPILAPWQDRSDPSVHVPEDVIGGYKWELYHVAEDFSEAVNLAEQNPDKLHELQLLFYAEAAKYNVLPLDDSKALRLDPAIRPSLTRGRTEFTYYGNLARIPEGAAPDVENKSFRITADVVLPKGGEQGIVVTQGGLSAGYALMFRDGKAIFHYNLANVAHYNIATKEALSPGKHTVVFDFKYDGGDIGKGGTGTISVDGKEVAQGRIANTMPVRFSFDETFDIGEDTGTPVSADYDVPFKFTGQIEKVVVSLGETKLSAADQEKLESLEQSARLMVE